MVYIMLLCAGRYVWASKGELLVGRDVAVSGTLSAARSKHACFAMPCMSWKALLCSGLQTIGNQVTKPLFSLSKKITASLVILKAIVQSRIEHLDTCAASP